MTLKLNEAWKNYYEAILTGKKCENSEIGRWKNHIAPILGEIPIETLTGFHFLRLKKI